VFFWHEKGVDIIGGGVGEGGVGGGRGEGGGWGGSVRAISQARSLGPSAKTTPMLSNQTAEEPAERIE